MIRAGWFLIGFFACFILLHWWNDVKRHDVPESDYVCVHYCGDPTEGEP